MIEEYESIWSSATIVGARLSTSSPDTPLAGVATHTTVLSGAIEIVDPGNTASNITRRRYRAVS
jgi:hypothetical protein